MSNRFIILLLAFFTLVGFPAIGYLIFHFFGEGDLLPVLTGQISIVWQILAGFPIGWVAAWVATKLIQTNFMLPVRKKYVNLINVLNLRPWQVIYISICAGVGEELLFRGAIQPLWGVWITSIFFVALHGYLNPMDKYITVYGIYLTVVIIGLGFMTQYWGIWSSAAAHTAIDIVLIQFLNKSPLNQNTLEV